MRLGVFTMAALVALGFSAPTFAHRTEEREQGAAVQHAAISQQRALEVAAAQGVAHVREARLRRGVWKIEGHTAQGREIEVEIDAHSGEVVKREIE